MAEIAASDIILLIVIAVSLWFLAKLFYFTPHYIRVDEPFYGGAARGTGHPDCLRTLPEASQLLDLLSSKGINSVPPGINDASADYMELQLILSKMACLKKDLMSPSGIVDATRYQAFETSHDRVAVAELCGMCFSQTVSSRDLDIVFATWRDRGKVLLRKVCTEGGLSEVEVVMTEKLFHACWSDVYDISKSRCLKTDFSKQNGGETGGDVGAYEPTQLKDQRAYENKYGGLSASGWNGAV